MNEFRSKGYLCFPGLIDASTYFLFKKLVA